MRICDIAKLMHPWNRLRISGENQFDADGNHIWTNNLSDAQKFAYWEHEIISHYIEPTTLTIFCIVKEK